MGSSRRRKPKATSKPSLLVARRPSAASLRNERILIAIVLLYVAVLVTMVASERYVFVVKSLVVPVLLLAALLSGRLKRFINEWVVFLAAVEFFDFGRGLVFALTSHFELPMHLQYVVAVDRWLCAGEVAPVVVQKLRSYLSNPYWLDRFFFLVYSSHFVFFLIFGLTVWIVRPRAFRTYAIAILATMYGGLLGYFLVPTVPPWMASSQFAAIPEITQFVRTIYNVHLPHLLAAFDVNTIAAMPSVHAAIPALCALFALQQFGRRGLPVLVYAILVWMAVIYLGEHYLTDVIAGILLAVVVHWLVSRLVPVSAADDEVSESEVHWQVRPIAIALGLVAVAYGFGQLSVRWIGPLPVTQTFVERELLGRSPVARYLLGRIAFEHNDFAKAEVELTRSLGELPLPAQQRVVRSFLGASAYHNGHLTAAIAALEPLRSTPDDLDSLIVLSRSYVESGDYDEGIALLKEVRGRFPAAPDPLYWLTRYEYSQGEADRMQVAKAIDALRQFPPDKTESMTRSLGDLLRNDRARSGG